MQYRELGKTGLKVSVMSLGTVSLGVLYGIPVPDGFGIPSEAESLRLLEHAAETGINLFDTAPAYGESERLLGLAVGSDKNCHIATKITIPKDVKGAPLTGNRLRSLIYESLENSLSRIRRDVLDIVQIHNATLDVIGSGEVAGILLDAKQKGIVRFLGASVYTEDEAMAVIKNGAFDTVQVAYNMLDRRMARNVFPAAKSAGVAIMARSALFKGMLTAKAQWAPSELSELKDAVEKFLNITGLSWHCLAETAMRFCISDQRISTMLLGARTIEELNDGISAVEAGSLSASLMSTVNKVIIENENLLNPSCWPIP
jgi:aryl-alcohol dehydrogenase-like predicted oxidoreductase